MIRISSFVRAGLLPLVSLPFLFPSPALGVDLPDGFHDFKVAEGIQLPVALAFLPDGRALVTEQWSGKILLVVGSQVAFPPLVTLDDVDGPPGETGLVGIAVDRGWPSRPYVYVHYTRGPDPTIRVTRFTASGNLTDGSSHDLSLGARYDILTDIPDYYANHNGGTLEMDAAGMLYVSIGDDQTECAAADSTDYRGTVLRLDVSALPDTGSGPPPASLITPADNPFPSADPVLGLVFCFGLRNPYTFHVDDASGSLFIGDVGSAVHEEIDRAWGGENFGWPFREGTVVRSPFPCVEPGGPGAGSYVEPIREVARIPAGNAIIMGPRYHAAAGGSDNFPPAYEGLLFYGDFVQGYLRVIEESGGGWALLDSVPGQPDSVDWARGLDYVSDIELGPDGSLYYVAHDLGQIRRIGYSAQPLGARTPAPGESGVLRLSRNPFLPARGALEIRQAGGGNGRLEIFDVRGRRMRALEAEGAGRWRWDGETEAGREARPGVYFLRAKGEAESATRVLLLR